MTSSKSCGPNSIPTNLLIDFSEVLASPLSCIINMSLKEGVFPSLLKEADVCPIHKKMKCLNVRIIGRFHSLLILAKYLNELCILDLIIF